MLYIILFPNKEHTVADLIDAAVIHATLMRATPEQVYEALTTAGGLDS